MKKYQFQNLSHYLVGMLLCVVFSSTIAHSQGKTAFSPVGEELKYCANVTLDASITAQAKVAVAENYVGCTYRDKSGIQRYTPLWRPESSFIVGYTTIEVLDITAGRTATGLKVLLNDGTIVKLLYTYATFAKDPQAITLDQPVLPEGGYGESYKGVCGDATYVLSSSYVYVYRDSVSLWEVDSTGLIGATITGISLDTAQYVYAATTKGVFKQHPDSSVWHQITNLPTNGYQSILVDRRNRIFAAYYANFNGKGTYISTDNGSTWTQDSAGIGTMQIFKLSDDAYGNTYAIANGYEQLYRRKNNTPGWTRIEGGITAITVNPVTINFVGGDSVLYAATSFGLYSSTDQGTTWTDANAGIPASNFYAFAKGAGGKWFTSTNLAMYSLGPTDTSWSKIYPAVGYQRRLPILTDGLGNIYTSFSTNTGLVVYKSSNNGSTWSADSVALNQFSLSVFFIDEKGGQHTADNLGPRAKPYGGSWGPDTAGFQVTNSSSNYSAAMASDRHGYLYLSGKYFNGSTRVNGQVMRRPIDGGGWLVDTVGLSGFSYLDALYAGKDGEMYGTYRPNLVHRSSSGVWSTLNLPSFGAASITNMVLSVDSSGAVFIAVRGSNANSTYGGLGVYFSTDAGVTWEYAGLDGIFVNQLVSYGDSTYAATNNGLYILTRTAVVRTGVQQVGSAPTTYALHQNYPNPFNPTTVIGYQLKVKSFVTLTVYDVLGRKAATLVDQEQPAGSHSIHWDAANFSSGIYFYQLKALQKDGGQAGSFVETKKMILMK